MQITKGNSIVAHENIEARYINGDYLRHNPTWDIGHSPRKAKELRNVIPDEYLKNMFDNDPRHVVEIGCGAGGVLFHFSELLNKEGLKNTPMGYDISPTVITIAKKKFGHAVQFFCSKEIHLDKKASVILLIDVLEHMLRPSDFLLSIKRWSNYFLIRLPLDKSLWNMCLNKFPKLKKELGHIHFYNYRDALNLVQEQGLEIINHKFTNNFSDKTNRKTIVSNLMFPVRSLTSLINQKINCMLWGGNSIVIFAASARSLTGAVEESIAPDRFGRIRLRRQCRRQPVATGESSGRGHR
jgi:SAM-dependent methyltransferase